MERQKKRKNIGMEKWESEKDKKKERYSMRKPRGACVVTSEWKTQLIC